MGAGGLKICDFFHKQSKSKKKIFFGGVQGLGGVGGGVD